MTPTPAPLPRPPLPLAPVLGPPPTPQPAPFLQRFLSRKFLVPALVLVSVLGGVLSHAIPLDVNTVILIIGCVGLFLGIEGALDWRRLSIPQAPGPLDDIARLALEIAKKIDQAPAPGPTSADAPPAGDSPTANDWPPLKTVPPPPTT